MAGFEGNDSRQVQGTNRKGCHLTVDCNVILVDRYNHCSFVRLLGTFFISVDDI